MQESQPTPADSEADTLLRRRASPRSDLIASLVWIVLGAATTIGSWNMDRLEKQDVNPYTVPGLLPGLLGVAIMFFGALMTLRAAREGALEAGAGKLQVKDTAAGQRRLWLVLALCLAFGVGLVGHGLPFWLAAALFISITMSILQYPARKAAGESVRGIVVAGVIGICAGLIITLVFQEFFLVRLP